MRLDRKEVVELMAACANAAHAEYHLVETMAVNKDKEGMACLAPLLDDVRGIRVGLMAKLSSDRPNADPLWCVLKHMMLLQFHLYELYEKSLDPVYLDLASRTMLAVDGLLGAEGLEGFVDCPRCDSK